MMSKAALPLASGANMARVAARRKGYFHPSPTGRIRCGSERLEAALATAQ